MPWVQSTCALGPERMCLGSSAHVPLSPEWMYHRSQLMKCSNAGPFLPPLTNNYVSKILVGTIMLKSTSKCSA